VKLPATESPIVINGWTIFAHPLFLLVLEALIGQVALLRARDPRGFTNKNAAKRLAAIVKLAFEVIPEDPTRVEYRQGGTLGKEYHHWFRAKFFQQYRLFFRYHRESRIIIYSWINDENTKRAYESDTDAYRVFRRMLKAGRPPDDWSMLLKEAARENRRLSGVKGKTPKLR